MIRMGVSNVLGSLRAQNGSLPKKRFVKVDWHQLEPSVISQTGWSDGMGLYEWYCEAARPLGIRLLKALSGRLTMELRVRW